MKGCRGGVVVRVEAVVVLLKYPALQVPFKRCRDGIEVRVEVAHEAGLVLV